MRANSLGLIVLLAACGPTMGGSSGEESGGASTGGEETANGSGETGVVPTTGDGTTGGPLVTPTCDDILAGRDVAAGLLVYYNFGNQIEGTELRVFVDGSIYHNERTCCPPTGMDVPETLLDAAALMTLTAQASAVIAGGSMETDLGVMAEGQPIGVMCVFVNGVAGTVRAFDLGDTVVKRVSTAPEAADVAALVHGYAAVDMPE